MKRYLGGSGGNEQLTAVVATLLLVLRLHKASSVVWLGALGVHVLTRLPRLWSSWQLRIPGLSLRLAAVTASLLAGFAVATLTLPAADQLQDGLSAHIGVDDR